MQNIYLKRLAVISASVLFLLPASAYAAYIPPAGAGNDGNCAFTRSWGWTFPAAGADNLPAVTGSNWTVNMTSGALAAGRSLSVTVTHVDPAADGTCHPNMEAASPAHVLNFGPADPPPAGNPGPLQRPNAGNFVKAAASQEGHGPHFDIVKASVTVPAAGNANIVVSGIHAVTAGTFTASILNNTNRNITASVTPDYRKADGTLVNGPTINAGNVPANTDRPIPLPQNDADLHPLASYIVKAAGSPVTETHLAFLGNVDGVFSELDMAAATALFAGSQDFFVPVLSHATLPIYVGVDLVQWLSDPIMPSIGEIISITNGTSALLPGFLFSQTDDIAIDPILGGFVTANPLNGEQVVFEGISIDGRVPEPPTLALLVLGSGLFMTRRFKKKQPA